MTRRALAWLRCCVAVIHRLHRDKMRMRYLAHGRGAVVAAAGAVVTRPVPPYAIVTGNPARVVRLRFADPVIAAIEATRWWELDTPALRQLVLDQPDLIFRPECYFA